MMGGVGQEKKIDMPAKVEKHMGGIFVELDRQWRHGLAARNGPRTPAFRIISRYQPTNLLRTHPFATLHCNYLLTTFRYIAICSAIGGCN
jgi:hypothetical protein